ncbi:MAG TPA: hypothetical protein VMA95_03405 [Streptosporangiaceae bacterium]|nr:hypothetical protein [Streptosporangiaceae bacterium]
MAESTQVTEQAAPGVNGSMSQNGTVSQNGHGGTASTGTASTGVHSPDSTGGPAGHSWTLASLLALTGGILRRNWIASILVAAGIVMRVITEYAYHPAILYIDTLKYLYDAWPGSDPVLYKVPLKMILKTGGTLGTVELIQHTIGILMAIAIYAVVVRRGGARWLAAIAMVPVLFDGYQLQAEAMIMPDIWFEALIVAGLAVLLWQPRPTLTTLVFGSLLLGGSVGMRQVGEIFIVPVVVLVVVLGGGLVKVLTNVAAVVVAFALAIVLYMGASKVLTGHFRVSESSASLTYGRMASVVNCATLNVPSTVKLLCPTQKQKALGPDWLEHSVNGPLRTLTDRLPASLLLRDPNAKAQILSKFNHAVEEQQTLSVVSAVVRDSVKLFALTRETSPGDTPIWRWQFHGYFPTYGKYVFTGYDAALGRQAIFITLPQSNPQPLASSYGGAPQVNVTLARFLRAYQLNGGYTPGPFLALCTLLGLIGSVMVFWRRRLSDSGRQLAIACLAFFVSAITVLGMSDAFEFSWRYQLPALVTLPVAGALGAAVILDAVRRRRQPQAEQPTPDRAPELAAPAQ